MIREEPFALLPPRKVTAFPAQQLQKANVTFGHVQLAQQLGQLLPGLLVFGKSCLRIPLIALSKREIQRNLIGYYLLRGVT